MPHEGNLLQAAVVFLFAAVLTVPLAKRLQLGAVLGYLFAGVIIGPSVLGLIGNPQSVSAHLRTRRGVAAVHHWS
jgi:glutathione-regulated potassium-efflux system protein KefB